MQQALDVLLIGGMARTISEKHGILVTAKQIRALIERGRLPEPSRLGPFRAFSVDDLPAIEEALRDTGHLPDDEGGDDAA